MKTIFKYLATLVVISLISITFMAATHKTENNKKSENPPPCWIEPTVNLNGACVFSNQNTKYVINMKIYNICNNPSTLLYNETNEYSTENGNSFNFCISDTLCTTDIVEKCFEVVVTAAKVIKTNGTIVCSGQNSIKLNCEDLMDFDIDVELN